MIIRKGIEYMIRDPKKHSQFKTTIYTITEIFDDNIKLDNGYWYSRKKFESTFMQINRPNKKFESSLPLYEKMNVNYN